MRSRTAATLLLAVVAAAHAAPQEHLYSLSTRGADSSLHRTALHIVNDSGEAFTLHLERLPLGEPVPLAPSSDVPTRSYARYWTIRILDPAEEIVFQREYADVDTASFRQQHVVPARGKGVYQVLINAGMGGEARIWTEPDLPVATDSRCYPWYLDDTVDEAFVYIPNHTTRVLLDLIPLPGSRNRAIAVYDEDGRELARVAGEATPQDHRQFEQHEEGHNIVTLEPEHTDTVWRLALEGSGPFNFHLDHVPALLAFDAQTARRVRGSVIEVGDDTMLHHEFQRQLWEIVHRFEPSDFDVEVEDLDLDELAKTPRLSAIALGRYGPLSVLPKVLEHQNTDLASHWFGSIHNWESRSQLPPPQHRWDRDRPAPWEKGRGYQVVGRGMHSNLAWAYATDFPGNPYYKNPALLKRTVIALAIHLLRMTEEDVFNEFEYNLRRRCWLHYHFDFPENGTQPFHYIADDLPAETRHAIEQGLRRQAEHLRYFHSDCTNQWAIMLHGHWHMHRVTGEDTYRDLVDRHLESLIRDDVGETDVAHHYHVGQAPSGYFREIKGFDGPYNSVSAFHLGALYMETDNPALLDALRRSFTLRNHLTLTEPNGSLVSPTNMNHRTQAMASQPYYPDAALCTQFLPEAATWMHAYRAGLVHELTLNVWRPNEVAATLAEWVPREWNWSPTRAGFAAIISTLLVDYLRDVDVPESAHALPHQTDDRYLIERGGEWIFAKRPGYYAIIYPGGEYRGQRWCRKTRRGGGLSALWSPGIGTTVFSINEGDTFNHAFGGTFERDGEESRFGSSWSKPTFEIDEEAATLTVRGRTDHAPLSYERRYHFRGEAIRVSLVIEAEQRFAATTAFEDIPFLTKEGMEVTLLDESLAPIDAAATFAHALDFAYGDAGMTVLLDQPMEIDLSTEPAAPAHGRAAVAVARLLLPEHFEPEAPTRLEYLLVPRQSLLDSERLRALSFE